MAQKEMIRIRLKAYDHQLIDQSAEKIRQAYRRRRFRPHSPAYQERGRYHPAGCTQV